MDAESCAVWAVFQMNKITEEAFYEHFYYAVYKHVLCQRTDVKHMFHSHDMNVVSKYVYVYCLFRLLSYFSTRALEVFLLYLI